MSTRHQIYRLHIRAQRLRSDRTDPALAALVAGDMRMVGRMLIKLGVNLKVQLDHIAERLDPVAQDLLAVGLGADALGVVLAEQELQHGVFVVQIPGRV